MTRHGYLLTIMVDGGPIAAAALETVSLLQEAL
jgi:hypothetical protein